jgi:hypothetical protein
MNGVTLSSQSSLKMVVNADVVVFGREFSFRSGGPPGS